MSEDAMPRITMSIRLGPMVHFQIEGQNCTEISQALDGFEHLNKTVDDMFSDLAERVYPDLDTEGNHAPVAEGGKT
ncbi:hypothetical protein OKW43_008073 [Paraburkholderia sp. WC7.3g]|jgi:hypothetical protein|uniref:Uncharacterized protein n=1 Tax=Paraburkholderia panacisoli TaxID=2603818 RepID=A0A5B0GPH9_9BURK|nr:hypothetical protein [Paraburkholderia panacisoli]KAA1003839.1 hypothetical protein FVF58_34720 [Paraburkholderia panacisoli]